jgi:hypothetical protein
LQNVDCAAPRRMKRTKNLADRCDEGPFVL